MTAHDIDSEDWLDAALKASGQDHRAAYIADDGFTTRVMAGLPAAATLPAWRRPAIVLLWLLAAAGAIVALPGVFDDAFRGAVALLVRRPLGLGDIAMMLTLCGAAAWASLVYVARAG